MTRGTKQIRMGRVTRLVRSLEIEKSAWERRLEEAREHYANMGLTLPSINRETKGERARVDMLDDVLNTIVDHFKELREEKERG